MSKRPYSAPNIKTFANPHTLLEYFLLTKRPETATHTIKNLILEKIQKTLSQDNTTRKILFYPPSTLYAKTNDSGKPTLYRLLSLIDDVTYITYGPAITTDQNKHLELTPLGFPIRKHIQTLTETLPETLRILTQDATDELATHIEQCFQHPHPSNSTQYIELYPQLTECYLHYDPVQTTLTLDLLLVSCCYEIIQNGKEILDVTPQKPMLVTD